MTKKQPVPRAAQKPSIGRIVHLHDRYFPIRAALIVKVHDEHCVNLIVFNDEDGPVANLVSRQTRVIDDPSQFSYWSWPPRD